MSSNIGKYMELEELARIGFQNILIPSLANIQEDSRGTPISFSNKTDCHDIHEIILLKVVLNTITLTLDYVQGLNLQFY